LGIGRKGRGKRKGRKKGIRGRKGRGREGKGRLRLEFYLTPPGNPSPE